MKADEATEAAVMETFNLFARYYGKREMDNILELMVPDPDIVMYGSGSDEKRIGIYQIREQFTRDWKQSESASFRHTWHSVSMSGNVAWLAVDCVARATVKELDVILPFRITAVLEKRGDRWLFAQWHGSIPLPSQEDGSSFAA